MLEHPKHPPGSAPAVVHMLPSEIDVGEIVST